MADVKISIVYPEGNNIAGANIYRSSTDKLTWTKVAYVTGKEYIDKGLATKTRYWYALCTVTKDNKSMHPWEANQSMITCYEQVSIPASPTNFTGVQNGVYVNLSWTANTEADFDHYEIRRGSLGWSGSELLSDSETGISYQYTWAAASKQTFMIRAVDEMGNKSTGYAEVSVDIQDVANFLVDSSVTHTSTYPGSHVNTEISGTDLQIAEIPSIADLTGYIADYDFPIWNTYYDTASWIATPIDFGSEQTVRMELDTTHSVDNTSYGYIYDLTTPIGGYSNSARVQGEPGSEYMLDEVPIAGDESPVGIMDYIDISTTASTTATWQGFRVFTPGDFSARHVRFKTVLTSRWGLDRPRRRSYIIRKLLKNKKIEGGGIVIPTVGLHISFATYAPNYTFVNSPKVIAMCDSMTSAPYHVEVEGLTSDDFTAYVYNASGTAVGGQTITFHALGT